MDPTGFLKPSQPVAYSIKYSFYASYVFMLTTGTITFIEAIRTADPMFRHIMNLETCISIVAAYFYSNFIAQVAQSESTPIDWKGITLTRYVDWSITTPMMLLAFMISLSLGLKQTIHLSLYAVVVALNYAMLYLGYMGETDKLGRGWACAAGFVPFLAMYYLIYTRLVAPKNRRSSQILFAIFATIWALYGAVYLLEEEQKNFYTNVLDVTAKSLVGIGIWAYFTHIFG
jgi:bacteriorhodopsin